MPAVRIVVVSQETSRPATMARVHAERGPSEIELRVFRADALREPAELLAAVSRADVLVLTHLLTEELIGPALELVAAAPGTASVVVLQSLRELVFATRVRGRPLQIDGLPRELSGMLQSANMGAGLEQLLKRVPELVARLGTNDSPVAVWLTSLLYWAEASPDNLVSLVRMWAARCAGLALEFEAPIRHVSTGLYAPGTGITDDLTELARPAGARATVGLLVMRGAVLADDRGAIDTLVAKLEARGILAIPAFADSFDFREPIERWFADVDLIVSLTGFPLVGGHRRHDAGASADFLNRFGRPYLTPVSLMMQSVSDWRESRFGLAPMEIAMQTAIHEAEGGIEPLVVHGQDGDRRTLLEDRGDRLVARIERWLSLRSKPAADKRLLVTVFRFPPDRGAVGTAAYLDVFESAHAVLKRLAAEGYRIDLPPSPADLLERIVRTNDASFGNEGLAVGARLDVATYERITPGVAKIERLFGRAPGTLQSEGRDVIVHGVDLGNVFVGVQPSFGYEGDPMRLLFEPTATPHHGFAAYYRWAEHVYGADAVIHVGTHGSLEFMPGKQVGLSSECWPDALLGSLPHFYLYAVNNPSEGTIAKRRGHAVTIGHLTPPCEHAGLYRELEDLRAMIHEYAGDEPGERRDRTAEALVAQARQLHLDRDVAVPEAGDTAAIGDFVSRLAVALDEISTRRIPSGLHTIGRTPEREETIELLTAIAEHERKELGVPSFVGAALDASGHALAAIEAGVRAGDETSVAAMHAAAAVVLRVVTELVDRGPEPARLLALSAGIAEDAAGTCVAYLDEVRARLAGCDELSPLVAGLEGRFVAPGKGGDPVRCPEVLPTGRNLHALDPADVPSQAAMQRAEHMVTLMLERRTAELGECPRRIGMVLWGLDNIKTHGEAIAQAFWLLGTRPARNSIGRVADVEVVPLEELGRPRIDVVFQSSGIFRDIFGVHLELLDRATRLVSALDEPVEKNFVRAEAVRLARDLGFDATTAATRVFSNASGQYGAHVDHMVGIGSWESRDQLAELWLDRKGFSYGKSGTGRDDKKLLAALADGIDTTWQNIDSSEVSLIDVDHYFEYLGGLSALVETRSGKRPANLVGDATSAVARVRGLEEALRLETRTKLLNPRWYEGMLRHGFEGVEEIKKRFDYTFGWSATADAVDPWIYREVHRTFIADEQLRNRMREHNVHSYNALVRRLVEADGRGFWHATPIELEQLHDLQGSLEDELEGVVRPEV